MTTQRSSGILTPMQTKVMELLVAGLTNAEIARRLYISEATVKSHLRSISNRLGHADVNRVLLTVWWLSFKNLVDAAMIQQEADTYADNTVKTAFLAGVEYGRKTQDERSTLGSPGV